MGPDDSSLQWTEGQAVFGVPMVLVAEDARNLLQGLQTIFAAQKNALVSLGRVVSSRDSLETASERVSELEIHLPDRENLAGDLELLRAWFDPSAKGAKVREAVVVVPSLRFEMPFENPVLVVDAGKGRRLVTPEGRTLMSCLRAAFENREPWESSSSAQSDHSWIRIRNDDVSAGLVILLATYRRWTRHRLDDVIGLLTSETSTLRPAAAGLLLTLLINRNTDSSRALPRPDDARKLQSITEAIAGPAAAYATTLTGSRTTNSRSLDLYRGWPLGELRRRLGPALHSEMGSGIYLEPDAVDDAVERLVMDIRRRPPRLRVRVPAALDATLEAYELRRPQLAGLGLAFERPAQTRRVMDSLREAALAPDVGSNDDPSDIGSIGSVTILRHDDV